MSDDTIQVLTIVIPGIISLVGGGGGVWAFMQARTTRLLGGKQNENERESVTVTGLKELASMLRSEVDSLREDRDEEPQAPVRLAHLPLLLDARQPRNDADHDFPGMHTERGSPGGDRILAMPVGNEQESASDRCFGLHHQAPRPKRSKAVWAATASA